MSERSSHNHLKLVPVPAKQLDPAIARVIALMHEELARAWTVTELARRVGLSRPAFARRFVAEVGLSPLRYLTRCRMDKAAALLAESEPPLAQIAREVGYASEYAFNRAFKRQHQVAPGRFRRQLALVRRAVPEFRMAA